MFPTLTTVPRKLFARSTPARYARARSHAAVPYAAENGQSTQRNKFTTLLDALPKSRQSVPANAPSPRGSPLPTRAPFRPFALASPDPQSIRTTPCQAFRRSQLEFLLPRSKIAPPFRESSA